MTTVIACVVLIASAFGQAGRGLEVAAGSANRAPSAKFCSSTPMMKRTMPFITNMTPSDTMTRMIGAAFCLR